MEDSNQDHFLSSEDQQTGMRITDFNDHILWKFWDYLDLVDLANVSDTNERLAASTKTFFSIIYKTARLNLRQTEHGIDLRFFGKHTNFHNNSRGQRDFHNFFAHFGDCLTHIGIILANDCKNDKTCFTRLIGKYCSKTLLELDLYERSTICYCFSEHTPLIRLQKLSISDSFGYSRGTLAFDSINRRYPNLRSLEVYEIRKIDNVFLLNQRLPHLEHFGIYFLPSYKFNVECVQFLRSILNLNPQIRSLGLDGIEELYDEFSLIDFSNIEDIEIKGRLELLPSFDFPNLNRLIAIAPTDLRCQNIPVTLQKLELISNEFNDELLNIIQQCHNLTSFSINIHEGFNLKCVEKIAQNMTQLQEFTIVNFALEKESIDSSMNLCFSASILFIKNCDRLRKANVLCQLYGDGIAIRGRQFTTLNSKKFLSKFKEDLKKSLITQHWRHWSMVHEVRHIDLVKFKFWAPKEYLCIKLKHKTRFEG